MNDRTNEIQSHPFVPFHPAHTHTPRSNASSHGTNHHLLLCTTDTIRCTTYNQKCLLRSVSHRPGKAGYRGQASTHDNGHILPAGLSRPALRCAPASSDIHGLICDVGTPITGLGSIARRCVTAGCDRLIQFHSHGDAPADIAPR